MVWVSNGNRSLSDEFEMEAMICDLEEFEPINVLNNSIVLENSTHFKPDSNLFRCEQLIVTFL